MKYLIVYQNSGEDEESKLTIDCDDETKIFTQLFLNIYYDRDLKLGMDEANEIIFEEVILPISRKQGIQESNVTDQMIENYCRKWILRDENTILLIKNLNNNTIIYDALPDDSESEAGVRYF